MVGSLEVIGSETTGSAAIRRDYSSPQRALVNLGLLLRPIMASSFLLTIRTLLSVPDMKPCTVMLLNQ